MPRVGSSEQGRARFPGQGEAAGWEDPNGDRGVRRRGGRGGWRVARGVGLAERRTVSWLVKAGRLAGRQPRGNEMKKMESEES